MNLALFLSFQIATCLKAGGDFFEGVLLEVCNALKMKFPFKYWLAFAVVGSAACAVFFFLAAGPADQRAKSPAQKAQPAVVSPNSQVSAALPAVAEKAPPNPAEFNRAAPLTEEKSAILATIQEVSVSYSAEELPKIRPFLLHPDPEVRAAALQGMIAVSDASAGPMFREAALQAPTPEEAETLRKAADYIELPSGSLIRKNRTPKP